MPDAFIEGIDVSSNQGQVDWAAVLGAGKAFAFARATVGGHQADPRFSANWQNMCEAGTARGVSLLLALDTVAGAGNELHGYSWCTE